MNLSKTSANGSALKGMITNNAGRKRTAYMNAYISVLHLDETRSNRMAFFILDPEDVQPWR